MTRLLVPLLLVACSGDGADAGTDDTALSGTAAVACTATVDGAAWEAAPETAFWASYHADSLTISCATADSSSALNLNISGYTGPGSYALTEGQTYAQLVGGALSTDPGAWVSSTGTVDVTRDAGGVVEGTFSFEGTDATSSTTKVITDGVFVLDQG